LVYVFLLNYLYDLNTIRVVIFILGVNIALEFPIKSFTGLVGAYLRYDLISYTRLFVLLLSTGLIVYFISNGYGIIALATITFLGSQISNILFFLIAKYLFKELKINLRYFKKSKLRSLLGYSVWSFLISLSEQLRFRVDSIVIVGFLTPKLVTHYFVGARLADYFREIMFRATDLFMPIFTKYYTQNKLNELREKLLLITKLSTILASLGGGLIIIVGKAFVMRWMGEKYIDAYPVLVILIIAMVFEVILNPLKSVLFAVARHKYYAVLNTLEGVVNLSASILLISSYGINGVALGTLIPIVAFKIFFIPYYTCKLINCSLSNYFKTILLPIFFTLIYFVSFYFIIGNNLIAPDYFKIAITILLSIPAYVLVNYFVVLTKSERSYFKGMLFSRN